MSNTLYSRVIMRNIPNVKAKQFVLLTGFAFPLVQRTADTYDTVGFVGEYDSDAIEQRLAMHAKRSKATRTFDVTSDDVMKAIEKSLATA